MGAPNTFSPASRDRRRPFHGNLLAENGANREFESIECSGHPQTRNPAHRRRQGGILAQQCAHRIGDGAEIEQLLDARDHRTDDGSQGRRHFHIQGAAALVHRDRDPSVSFVNGNGTPIMRRIGHFHARDGAQTQIGQQMIPGEWRPKLQLHTQDLGAAGLTANRARAQTIPGFEQRVEATHAAEAAGECDLGLAERGFSKQPLGQQQPLRLRQFDRRYAELRLRNPAQMPIADAERCSQLSHMRARQRMLLDAGNGGAHQARHCIHGRKTRGSFRPAAKAWPETCALGGCRTGVEAHILPLRRSDRAYGPAVDAGRGHRNIKASVEARVAGPHCAITSV